MKYQIYQQSGFTLIELLIAAVSMTVLSVLISGVLANLIGAYQLESQNRQVSGQTDQALNKISQAIKMAQSYYVVPSSENQAYSGIGPDELLVLIVPALLSDGTAEYTAAGAIKTPQTLIYCRKDNGAGTGTLTEFRFNKAATLGTTKSLACTQASITAGLGGGINFISSTPLTSDTVATQSLKFRRVSINGSPANGVRIEMAMAYIRAAGIESRASDVYRFSAPIVLRTLVPLQTNVGFSN